MIGVLVAENKARKSRIKELSLVKMMITTEKGDELRMICLANGSDSIDNQY